MAVVKSRAMLAVTEDEIREPATQGLQPTWIVVEPLVFSLQVSRDSSLEIGDDEAHTPAWLEDAPALREQPPQFVVIEMFEHVGGIDGRDRAIREG